jgi:hypothetical protein
MIPHLLSRTHPAGNFLESLCRCSSVLDNETTFHKAGFETRVKKLRSLMRVAIHPKVPGYVFKVFFVDERQCEREKSRAWKGFLIRCKQAERIRRIIQECGIRHFRVPRKWLFYPPYHAECSPEDQPMILVAEFQDLLSQEENLDAWLNSVTEDHLDELCAIITGAGGTSYRPDNIPLTKQGQFSFIDTEHSSDSRNYESISPYLAPGMRQYWSDLIHGKVK